MFVTTPCDSYTRRRLRPIVETVLLCGKQNIAMRGHRDGGALNMPIEESVSRTTEGNFRALLQYRISGGDSTLQKHLETASKNATSIRKTKKNIVISCINDLISQQIVTQVKKARFFTAMLDKTADIANVEQASICVRYVYNNMINKRFLKFAAVIDRTGLG
ncbi:unnamed protein product [Didymodactylos carnosus]|uniref:DUF4371 domain-containing protein n=1 Tax=Didymodactylos carnosus TaxID=1234261 RepID=A0A815LZX2_9BILA|nr:unnamed protein product [Didymodactylos carnosus]CAF1509174.1 unnamed protein product [Didymodactylos carnosus]CAF4297214.1 unnamed protein product [Didymodactylos carnosus]CAF4301330.1 unnamed protein product [Didymodactylos carnosus]